MAATIYRAFDDISTDQSVDLDLLQVHAQANVIQSLHNARGKEEPWNKMYQATVFISEKHSIAISKPKLAKSHRENVPSDSVSEY